MKHYNLHTREGRNSFYNTNEWFNVRKYVLEHEPLCRKCAADGKSTPAQVIDHIIDINDDPEKCLDIDNLQPLCKKCHSSKTLKKTNTGKEPANKIDKSKITFKRKWTIKS